MGVGPVLVEKIMNYDSMAGVQERHRLVMNDGHPRTQRRRGVKTSPNQHSLFGNKKRAGGCPFLSRVQY
jgi:hypothetical protein